MTGSMDGLRLVVLGASSGIGLAVSRAAAARGARVAMIARSPEKLAQAAAAVGGNPVIAAADMTDRDALQSTIRGLGRIDRLVLTAVANETARAKPLAAITAEDVERSFDKLRGYVAAIQAAAPAMPQDGAISVLFGASALRPPAANFALLAAEAAAVPGLMRALARELAPIRLSAIMAGVVDTPIHAGNRDDLARWAQATLPARRFGTPDDIADAILFALANPYLTGQVVTVDGGITLI